MSETSKLSPALQSRRAQAGPQDLIEVVVELRPSSRTPAERGRVAMEARRRAFEADCAPVDEAVRKAGGKVLASAWLNQTLKLQVPAAALDELGRLPGVEVIDVPHAIHPEAR